MPLRDLGTTDISPAELEELRQEEEDLRWWSTKAAEFEQQYKGKYIAIVNTQAYVGDSFLEAYEKAKAADPTKEPIVEYIPFKKEILVL